MKFHYAGKYNGSESTLPRREHRSGCVAFKEMDIKELSSFANKWAFITIIILLVMYILRGRTYFKQDTFFIQVFLGCITSSILMLPVHEFLHAVCFREDVYMYTYLERGLIFVIGTENMSKARFIFMSLCPNIFLGFIPYILAIIFPNLIFLGFFGAISIGMGFGDYINVYNAATQMPKNAKTYLYGTHSYWFIEDK